MTIVPMRDLKDTVKIEALCAKEAGPVFVTKNGYGKLVVMDVDYYQNLVNQAYEAAEVNKGLEDEQSGRVKDGSAVLAGMRAKYGI